MLRQALAFIALLLAAVSLGPSFAHVLEAQPRLTVWSPTLWREATVFSGQFVWFAWVGAPVDVAAILAACAFAWFVRKTPARRPAMAGAAFLILGLMVWALVVAGANATLATWRAGPIPVGFEAVRLRWETGHMVVAAAKMAGLVLLIFAVVRQARF